MPNSNCGDTMNCQTCPKAVDNTIDHVFHKRGFHLPASRCDSNFILFLLKGEFLVNSLEYAGTTIKAGEFILQAIGSKIEMLAMADSECIYYRFNYPELFCNYRYDHIMKEVPAPLISSPLKIVPALEYYLINSKTYLAETKICRELLSLKRKELAFILGYYYTDYELASLVHPLSQYTTTFQYFVMQNYMKVKTVEEFAQLGGYSLTTFRRIFDAVYHEPVYEWITKQRKESILYQLQHTDTSISEICFNHGFESLSHFSNFCKKMLGNSPRNIRKKEKAEKLSISENEASPKLAM